MSRCWKITLWYTKMRSTESNPAIVNSLDVGKCMSQVVAETVFFICQESVDLLSNLSADASPHQHFITLCKNRCVSPKLWFYRKKLFCCKAAAPCFPVAYWFPALETCSFLSQVRLAISGLWYILVNTPVLWSMKTCHTVNMPMFNLKESLPPWRWEMVSHLVSRTWLPMQWEA